MQHIKKIILKRKPIVKDSLAARAVAKEVIAKVRKGERPSIGKIAIKHGYAKSMVNHAEKITRTSAYKAEIKPFLQNMIEHRDDALQAIRDILERAKGGKRGVPQHMYAELLNTVDKFTRNVELLSGRPTDRDRSSLGH